MRVPSSGMSANFLCTVIISILICILGTAISAGAQESKFLGSVKDASRDALLYGGSNLTLLTNTSQPFPSDGHVIAFNVSVQKRSEGYNSTIQIWRPLGGSMYKFVGESQQISTAGPQSQHIKPNGELLVQKGDVLAVSSPGNFPLFYQHSKSACSAGTWMAINGVASGEDVTETFQPLEECGVVLILAEYKPIISAVDATSFNSTDQLPLSTQSTTPSSTIPLLWRSPNSTIVSTNTSLTSSTTRVSTQSPTEQSSTSTITTTTSAPTKNPGPSINITLEDNLSTATSSPPQTSPTILPTESFYGWEVDDASRLDGVRYGTIIPDGGKTFPYDGKIVGWEFNVTSIRKVGFQIWRPMPEHPNLFPHGRDFAFVGETKPVLPWQVGFNSFHVDQVGEAPIHVRKGDVISIRLDQPNPIPYKDSDECETRFYMDHHKKYAPCNQFIFEATSVCRVYPIRAIVIWETDEVKKPSECVDKSPDLAPKDVSKLSHIDGCTVLLMKSVSATYLLTNPDYPNIKKHRDLCWVIHLDPSLNHDLYIQIKVNDFNLHVPGICDSSASDFLEIRDGQNAQSLELKRFCRGWSSSNAIARTEFVTACQHFVYVRMRTSTSSLNFRGFKLHYQAVKKAAVHKTCVRPLPLTMPEAHQSRNAAIITIVVVAVVILTVFVVAYVRKRGFKPPQWLSFVLFKHRRFDNPDGQNFHTRDSPEHGMGQVNSSYPNTGTSSEYQLNSDNFDSAYVQFSPGGYPSNGQPVLHLGHLDSSKRSGTAASDSSVLEGFSDLNEIPDMSNGARRRPQRSQINTGYQHNDKNDGGSDVDLFPPPSSDRAMNNNTNVLPPLVIHDSQPNHSIT